MTRSEDHLLVAARWIEASMLGSLATVVAIVAVAAIGLGMLTGRVDLRRGLSAVVGCFILFGAPTIADGLLHLTPDQPVIAPSAPPPPPLPIPMPSPTAYDPYAGAAVPRAR